MNQFSDVEIKNIIALIDRVQITGAEATTVAVLRQKLISSIPQTVPEVKTEEATS